MNSKRIRQEGSFTQNRDFLVFIRCAGEHQVYSHSAQRNFDLVANTFAKPKENLFCDHIVVGGINKLQAFYQFADDNILNHYKGFLLLDDDLLCSSDELTTFFKYCVEHEVNLGQPSLTKDSYYTFPHLLTQESNAHREEPFIEVMCPYFSQSSIKLARKTFNANDSTWGIDQTWKKVTRSTPYVVDHIAIRHTRPLKQLIDGGFYKYMSSIGVDPRLDKRLTCLRYGIDHKLTEKVRTEPSMHAASGNRQSYDQ